MMPIHGLAKGRALLAIGTGLSTTFGRGAWRADIGSTICGAIGCAHFFLKGGV